MIEADRFVSPVSVPAAEEVQDRAIRPKTLEDYVGQPVVREQMEIFIGAAKNVAKHWTIHWFSDHRGWVKPHWQILSPAKWAVK